MSKNANHYSEDQLSIFENRLRSSGVWCDTGVKQPLSHKFICKNEKATVAISLCASIIAPFEKLHENTVATKCLVCALFDEGEKEVREHLQPTLENLLDTYVTKSQITEGK